MSVLLLETLLSFLHNISVSVPDITNDLFCRPVSLNYPMTAGGKFSKLPRHQSSNVSCSGNSEGDKSIVLSSPVIHLTLQSNACIPPPFSWGKSKEEHSLVNQVLVRYAVPMFKSVRLEKMTALYEYPIPPHASLVLGEPFWKRVSCPWLPYRCLGSGIEPFLSRNVPLTSYNLE